MASILVHTTQVFNLFDMNMGQSIDLPNNNNPDCYKDEKTIPSDKNISVKQDICDQHMDNDLVQSRQLINNSTSSSKDTCSGDYAILADDSGMCDNDSTNLSNTNDETPYHYKEELCAGEILHDPTPENISNVLETKEDDTTNNHELAVNGSLQAAMDWSEKKKQFSMTKHQQSADSFSSDLSSASRHSVSPYLYAREYDAEEILAKLGFGYEDSIDIPSRFLTNDSLLSSNIQRTDQTVDSADIFDDDVFFSGVTSTRTSFESSWSDSSFGRLPSRFTSSRSPSSLSSLSEPEDNDVQSVIPSIVEPVNDHDDGFDLMRYLRLNRGQHDKGFLEPVTEELEISSVGSGSARTKVAEQQDSFESVGNISVATRIFVPKRESSDLKHEEKEPVTSVPSIDEKCAQDDKAEDVNHDEQEPTTIAFSGEGKTDTKNEEVEPRTNVPSATSKILIQDTDTDEYERELTVQSDAAKKLSVEELIENTIPIETSVQIELEAMPDNLSHLSPLKPSLVLLLPQESFELEEIATSEENLDKMEVTSTRMHQRQVNRLRRDNSDDSSGFGDDAADNSSRKSSPKTPELPKEDIANEAHETNSPEKSDMTHLFVPTGMSSTPKDSATARRSIFGKRKSWSTSKQKRVVFEDQKCRSLDDLQASTGSLQFKSQLFDIASPTPINKSLDTAQDLLTNANSQNVEVKSQSFDSPSQFSDIISSENDNDIQTKGASSSLELKNIPLQLPNMISPDNVKDNSRKVYFKSQSLEVSSPYLRRSFSNSDTNLQANSCSKKVKFKSHSLDISLPLPINTSSDNGNKSSLNKEESDNLDRDSLDIASQTRQRTSSENKAIRNIKEFMSSLWSIRSKLKTFPIVSKTERFPSSKDNSSAQYSVENSQGKTVCSTLEAVDTSQHSVMGLENRTPSISVSVCQKSRLDELSAIKQDLQEYYSSFIAMELISTSQDRYYTRKLQARFAWDILFIRRLRSHIKEQLDEMQSNLEYSTALPLGVRSQMTSLLRLQSGLQEHLSTLSKTTTHLPLQIQTVKTTSLEISPSTLIQMENKIRDSVSQEIKSVIELQLGELRQEMKSKDSLIEELLKRIPKNETPL